jgi:hypothetical protein
MRGLHNATILGAMSKPYLDQHSVLLAEPFSWKASQAGLVFLEHLGRPVKILRGTQARRFLGRVERMACADVQLLIARLTGKLEARVFLNR